MIMKQLEVINVSNLIEKLSNIYIELFQNYKESIWLMHAIYFVEETVFIRIIFFLSFLSQVDGNIPQIQLEKFFGVLVISTTLTIFFVGSKLRGNGRKPTTSLMFT